MIAPYSSCGPQQPSEVLWSLPQGAPTQTRSCYSMPLDPRRPYSPYLPLQLGPVRLFRGIGHIRRFGRRTNLPRHDQGRGLQYRGEQRRGGGYLLGPSFALSHSQEHPGRYLGRRQDEVSSDDEPATHAHGRDGQTPYRGEDRVGSRKENNAPHREHCVEQKNPHDSSEYGRYISSGEYQVGFQKPEGV